LSKYNKKFIKEFLEKKKEEKAIKNAEKMNKEMREKREEAKKQFMLKLLENAKAINEAREDIEKLDIPNKEEDNG
jgi:hypothetical protein